MSNNTSTIPLPEIFVGKAAINKRIKNYLTTKHPVLSQALTASGYPKEDTRSIWYSKDHIKTWLDEMDLMEADGMRVYLGAYGEQEGPFSGQLCLLMVLTRSDEEGSVHTDIILEDEAGFQDREQASQRRSGIDGIFDEEAIPREYNYGSPCPPVCNGNGPAFPH